MAMELLRALRSVDAFLSDEAVPAAALCTHRPPFGLLDAGAASLVGLPKNASKHTACALLADRFVWRRPRAMRLQKHASCAVVGSGGILRNSGSGEVIDGHSAVIRFNGAPTLEQYRRDVGQRTTLQLSTLVPWRHWRRRVDAERLALTRDNVLYCHNHWLGSCWLEALTIANSSSWSRLVVNPLLVRLVGGLLSAHGSRRANRVPSSGAVGVAIAIATCAGPPSVFGFGNRSDARDNRVCDHYWECRTDTASYLGRSTHSFGAQWSLFRWLGKVGAIRLHAATPDDAFVLPAGAKRMSV